MFILSYVKGYISVPHDRQIELLSIEVLEMRLSSFSTSSGPYPGILTVYAISYSTLYQ